MGTVIRKSEQMEKVHSCMTAPCRQISVKMLLYFLPEFLPGLYFLRGYSYIQLKHYGSKLSSKYQI